MVLHPGCFLVALLPTLHPIIVRRAATGDLLIKVHVAGQPVKTLQRPAADTLARSLDRVSRSFAARKKKGTHRKSELCFLFDARGAELDPSMSALQAWSCAARLHVGVGGGANGGGRGGGGGGGEGLGSRGDGDGGSGETASLDVLFEPAEVVSLVLPAVVPFIGVPLTPSIETLGCDVRECRWVWERLPPGSAADSWQHVGSGREYQPSDDDDGARVRVRAVPPASGSAISAVELLSCVTEAAAPVEAPPPRPLLAHRVAAMRPMHRSVGSLGQAAHAMGEAPGGGEGEARRGGGAFRVLSYNVLADCYSRHWDQPGSIHSYCSKTLTRPAHRMPRLLGEVLAFAPDLVLLQEADRSWFEQYWLPAMRQRGYEGVYLKKSNPSGSEGVAAFVRSAALEIVEVRELSLAIEPTDALRPNMGAPVAALLDSQTGTRDGMQQLPTVAQLLLLREAAPASHAAPSSASQADSEETRDYEPDVMEAAPRRHLLVANTHLYFSNPAMHVRLLQTAKLLDEMNAWSDQLRAQLPAAAAPALIVAGELHPMC